MIVFGTKFHKTCFNDDVTWKPWRMCFGRRWRIENSLFVENIQHHEMELISELISLPWGRGVPDNQWQSCFPQEIGPFTELLGNSFMSSSVGVFRRLPVPPPNRKDQCHPGTIPDCPPASADPQGTRVAAGSFHTPVYCQWRTVGC